MYQIYDVLTGEFISKKDYDDMLRVEKVAKVMDMDEEKKEVHKLSPREYGFVKKSNMDRIEIVTADWKNHVFVDEYKNYGYLFAVRFAIRDADDSLTISVATKLHATVLKRTEEAVWFQTAIRGNTNTLSRLVDSFFEEKRDVFNIVILIFDDKRVAVKAYPASLDEIFSTMSVIALNGGRGLKTVSVDFGEKAAPEKAIRTEIKDLYHERNKKVHSDQGEIGESVDESMKMVHSELNGISEDWMRIRNRYPEQGNRIFEYAQLLVDEISNCKCQFDITAKKSITDGKYDDAHGIINQSQFLQECINTIVDLFEA